MTLAGYKTLSSNYPLGTSEEVKHLIGGRVNAGWITNTCAIRLCRSLNYAADEHKIPKEAGLNTVSGDDKLLYAYRVREMKTFLQKRYGLPHVTENAVNGVVDRSKFNAKNGIICFDVEGWADATGHFTLWDGSNLLYSGGMIIFLLRRIKCKPRKRICGNAQSINNFILCQVTYQQQYHYPSNNLSERLSLL